MLRSAWPLSLHKEIASCCPRCGRARAGSCQCARRCCPCDYHPKIFDERQATLQKIAPRLKSVLVYEYDFGDSWNHFITVEKILPADPGVAPGAECLDGARACPPEDCGGACGYADLLKILRHPRHEEHESILGWLGRPFDSEVFHRDSTNKHLRMLGWPKTTESQLRRVLMRRDGFKG